MTEPNSAQSLQRPPSIINIEGGSNPPPTEDRTALKASDIQKQLHSYLLPAASRPLFTSASSVALDCSADYSFVIRQFFNDLNIDSPLFSTEGMTTACNSMTGAVAAVRAYDRFKEAGAVESASGKIESSVDIVRGVAQSIGGCFYTAYRPLSITASIQGLDVSSAQAATMLGRSTFITGTVGNTFFGVFYAAMGGYFAYMLKRMYSFRGKFFQDRDIKKLDNVANVQDFMKFLTEKRLGVSPKSTLQKLLKVHSNSPAHVAQSKVKEQLKAACMASTKTWIKAIVKEARALPGAGSISEKDCEKIADRIFTELDAYSEQKQVLIESLGLSESMDPELAAFVKTLSFVELLGLDLKTIKREKRKEGKLAEFVGAGVVSALKKAVATGLTERLGSTDPVIQKNALEEAVGIVKEAQSNMKVSLFNNWCLLAAGVIGLIATIASFVFTGGAATIVVGALFLACAVAMLFPDLIYLKSAQESEGQTGSLDKWLLSISTIVGVVSLVAVIILGSVFSMGTVPLAIALAIGILWLASNFYSLYRLHKKEEMYGFNNPTFESLAKKIHVKTGEEKIDQKMMEQFKKLSISDRKALKAEAMKLGSVLSSSVRSLSESDQMLDKAHDFGAEFFKAHTRDPSVLRAAEKAYESARSSTLRGFFDRLVNLSKSSVVDDAAIEEIRGFFAKNLSAEERTLVAQNIYNKRAKKASSRSFESIKITDLKNALLAASATKKADHESARLQFLQHSIKMFSSLSKAAVA